MRPRETALAPRAIEHTQKSRSRALRDALYSSCPHLEAAPSREFGGRKKSSPRCLVCAYLPGVEWPRGAPGGNRGAARLPQVMMVQGRKTLHYDDDDAAARTGTRDYYGGSLSLSLPPSGECARLRAHQPRPRFKRCSVLWACAFVFVCQRVLESIPMPGCWAGPRLECAERAARKGVHGI